MAFTKVGVGASANDGTGDTLRVAMQTLNAALTILDALSGSSSSIIDITPAGQIAFPATQIPSAGVNVLDDYEEGLFTPGLTFGGAATGMTGTFTGKYTKVGNRVDFSLTIVLTAKGSSTGTALVTALPFTASNLLSVPSAVFMTNSSGMTMPMAYVTANASTVSLLNFVSNAASAINDTNFGNTTQVAVAGHYFVP
jgi:hypothetical protein